MIDGIPAALAAALANRGYDELTPVQRAVLDSELDGADALVSAQTGSGKTVAFGLAIAPALLTGSEALPEAGRPLALIIAPTRELALQVAREFDWLYAGAGGRVATCVGGMDYRTEKRSLERGAHIVVGTPGRLRDHIDRASLDMTGLRAVVLDEADEMLDLGFREDLEFILGAAPAERRTLMFSATVPRAIADLAGTFQRDARRVTVQGEAKAHTDIDYRAYAVGGRDREAAIINLLRWHDPQTAIVFSATRVGVTHLTARLSNRGFSVVALSGELSQAERTHALQAVRDGRARVCVATDVAARGIDLPGLELVIHADLPVNADTLLHRSGRTGRAGAKGVSALIVAHSERRKAERLLQWAKVQATWDNPPDADAVRARDDERLLSHPLLEAAPDEDEAALVAALMAAHDAQALAAGFLRLVRARQSAPEELTGQDAPKKRAGDDLGESQWISLSVGRRENAEARWILPLLCRQGRLDREQIGAIRVQGDHTLVQIAASAAPGFWKALGDGGVLEGEITARPAEAPAQYSPPAGPRAAREADEAPRKKHIPRAARRPGPAPARTEAPGRVEAHVPAARPVSQPPRPQLADERPARKPRPSGGDAGLQKPRRAEGDDGARKPRSGEDKPPFRKPAGKPGAKPFARKHAVSGDDAPRRPVSKGKPGPRPNPTGPKAKPAAPKRPAADARDTSRRFTPPRKGG
jgi:ATP-dependent RNA helicase DeaD